MTRQQAKDLLPIIQAFADDKVIEVRPNSKCNSEKWIETNNPSFDKLHEYRIKPEPKYRPFKNKKECWNEMLKHPPFGWINNTSDICSIVCVGNFGINAHNGLGIEWCDLKNALKLTFIDGTPFGIKEEE